MSGSQYDLNHGVHLPSLKATLVTATGDFGPAPAGLNLSETQNDAIMKSVITLMTVAFIFVSLRVYARTIEKDVKMAIDDYCVIMALIFAYGTAICCFVSLPYGGGKHLYVLTTGEFTTIWQILFAYVMIYAIAVTFTKLSIVLFYRRIFGMTWPLWICIFLVLSYCITIIVTITTGCQPLSYFWTQYTRATEGHCIDVPLFFFANGIWAMLVDVCILLVPLPVIIKLQMPHSQKLAVLGILFLGGFVCVASVIRIISIHTLINSDDLTWAMAQVFIWSCCEPLIGIVCACLPTLAPFFRRWWSAVQTRTGASDSGLQMTGEEQGTNLSGKFDTEAEKFHFRRSKSKWNRLHEDPKLRNDDEIELTNDISGPEDGSKRGATSQEYPVSNIRVTKDVRWSSTKMSDKSSEEDVGA